MQGIRYALILVERLVDYSVGQTFRSPDPEILLNAMKKQLKWFPRKEREGLERQPGGLEKRIKVLCSCSSELRRLCDRLKGSCRRLGLPAQRHQR